MERVAGEQGLALQQHFPYKFSKFSRNFKPLYKQYSVIPGAQTWPFGYFRYALSISGILQVIAHNIYIFFEKMNPVTPATKGLSHCIVHVAQLSWVSWGRVKNCNE